MFSLSKLKTHFQALFLIETVVSLKLFFISLPLNFKASYQLVKLGYQDNSSNDKKCFSYLHLEMKVNIQIVGSENYQ